MKTLEEKPKTARDILIEHLGNTRYGLSGPFTNEAIESAMELYATEKAKEAFKRGCEAQREQCAETWRNSRDWRQASSILTAPLAEYNEK